jgi:DNA-binding response OmpR family regulator
VTRVLVIEDEESIRENIIEILELEAFEVVGAENGLLGVEAARENLPDLIICDVTMPGLDGYEVLLELRQDPITASIPFVFLTARADRSFMRHGMELGADDYLTKPFRYREMLARVRALLRRSKSGSLVPEEGHLEIGRLVLDMNTHDATRDGVPLALTPAEFRILACLVQNRGHVVPCRAMLQYAQEYDAEEAAAREIVRVHIWRLRNKMDCAPGDEDYIQNIRGIGYMIR